MSRARLYTFGALGLAAILGAALFITSERVQEAERTLSSLNQAVATTQDSLHVLRAEWAYLNRPDRLEQLSATYLRLQPVAPNHLMINAHHIPEPMPEELAPIPVKAEFSGPKQAKKPNQAALVATRTPTPPAPIAPSSGVSSDQLISRLARAKTGGAR